MDRLESGEASYIETIKGLLQNFTQSDGDLKM